jgi:hypothetical protein
MSKLLIISGNQDKVLTSNSELNVEVLSLKKKCLEDYSLGGQDVIAALLTGFGKLESNIRDDTFCESHNMCAYH